MITGWEFNTGTAAAVAAGTSGSAVAATPMQNALVMDAMGEVREIYTDDLWREEGENLDRAMWPLYFEELNGPRRMEAIQDGLADRGFSYGRSAETFRHKSLQALRVGTG